MRKFKIGDKVVPCYDEEYGGYHSYLVEGEVYTVTSVKYGLIDIDGVMSPLAVGYGESCKFDWSEDWFKLADEQLLSNAFDKAVEEVGETFVAKSLIEKETEMNAEQIRDEILRIDVRIEEAKKDIENAEEERNSLVEKLRGKGFEIASRHKVLPLLDNPFLEINAEYVINERNSSAWMEQGTRVICVDIDLSSRKLNAKVEDAEGNDDWFNSECLTKI